MLSTYRKIMATKPGATVSDWRTSDDGEPVVIQDRRARMNYYAAIRAAITAVFEANGNTPLHTADISRLSGINKRNVYASLFTGQKTTTKSNPYVERCGYNQFSYCLWRLVEKNHGG